jgi:uroporphyrinogen decarboxylase
LVPKPSLSSRERVLLALKHQTTDRIPIAMVCAGINPPAYAQLETYLQRTRGLSVAAYLEPLIDIRDVAPGYIGPRLAQGTDIWGVGRAPISYDAGQYDEIVHYPLAPVENAADLDNYDWPTPDCYDYAGLPARIRAIQSERERCLIVGNGNIFETAWYMRGFERILLDMLLNPDLVHAIMGRVCEFYMTYFTRNLKAADGSIDLVFTADDLSGQRGPLMSHRLWREFIQPYHRRLNRAIHDFKEVRVIYHSDGAIQEFVPGLIEMGIDVLQALQFDAIGMDARWLKQRYGEKLCFEGGVSVQKTLPFGSVSDVREEVRRLIDTLGQGGGYILGPAHAIQAGTPPENVAALFDEAAGYYPF